MITPDLTRFTELSGKYNLIPVWKEITVDMDTPVSLFTKLNDSGDAFLLESIEGGERWGRYSFIGMRPFMKFGAIWATTWCGSWSAFLTVRMTAPDSMIHCS